jgi:general secretion pathway protein G
MIDVNTAKRVRRIVHRRREAMTLIEIMIVVIIMALIATAVGIAVLPQFTRAKEKTAESDVQTIRSAVQLYIMHGGSDCPTVEDLLEDGSLEEGKNTVDPWNNEYAIECDGDNITVISGGPDGQPGSEDDITS